MAHDTLPVSLRTVGVIGPADAGQEKEWRFGQPV
jgi:hypothetical protein